MGDVVSGARSVRTFPANTLAVPAPGTPRVTWPRNRSWFGGRDPFRRPRRSGCPSFGTFTTRARAPPVKEETPLPARASPSRHRRRRRSRRGRSCARRSTLASERRSCNGRADVAGSAGPPCPRRSVFSFHRATRARHTRRFTLAGPWPFPLSVDPRSRHDATFGAGTITTRPNAQPSPTCATSPGPADTPLLGGSEPQHPCADAPPDYACMRSGLTSGAVRSLTASHRPNGRKAGIGTPNAQVQALEDRT